PLFPPSTPPSSPRAPLSLHDALPISGRTTRRRVGWPPVGHPARIRAATSYGASGGPSLQARFAVPDRDRRVGRPSGGRPWLPRPDRKSTRLNSSHLGISYAVFCLKKK